MTIRSSWNGLRGLILELLGIALVIWLAAGFPGLSPEDAGTDPRRETLHGAPLSASPFSVASPTGIPPLDWPYSSAAADLLPPPADQRAAYTESRLRPAGRALWELTAETVAGWLPARPRKTTSAQ